MNTDRALRLLVDEAPDRGRRNRIVDVACLVISCFPAALTWLLLLTGAFDHPSGIEIADLLLTTVFAPLVWWRRRWPLAVSLLISAAASVSFLCTPAQAIALLTVAVHCRLRTVAVAAGAYVVSGALYGLIRPDVNQVDAWVALVFSVLAAAGLVAWGKFVQARRELLQSLRERARRAEAEQQQRVAQARQLERTRIAREMHDVLAHRISLLSLHAGALEFRPDAPPEEIAQAAGIVRSSAHQALQDLREVIGVLREGANGTEQERPQPTLGELPALVTEARRAGAKIDLDVRVESPEAAPTVIGRTAYRVVQEGLTNARKHAHGAAVRVTVAGGIRDGLTVEVRNWLPVSGLALDPGIPGTGTGIIGLTERVQLAGGELTHGTSPAGDFRLTAWLPWRA